MAVRWPGSLNPKEGQADDRRHLRPHVDRQEDRTMSTATLSPPERRTRSRRGTGHLYQRGAVWWAQYFVNGRRVQESTGATLPGPFAAERPPSRPAITPARPATAAECALFFPPELEHYPYCRGAGSADEW